MYIGSNGAFLTASWSKKPGRDGQCNCYNAAGNLLSRSDGLNTLTETFTFDSLDRLTSAQVGSHAAVHYGFDVAGSLVEKSDMGNPYLYNANPAHAVSEILAGGSSLHTYGYDANGNMDVVNGKLAPYHWKQRAVSLGCDARITLV